MENTSAYAKKNNSIQALRGIGCLSVFLYHSGVIKNGGAWGVELFFVLSGFLLMQKKYSNYGFLNQFLFAKEKIKKIYVLHIATTLFAIPLLLKNCIGLSNYILQCIIRFVFNCLLLQAWYPEPSFIYSMNSLSWFLSCLFFLYYLFPIIQKVISKYLVTIKISMYAIIVITFIWFLYLKLISMIGLSPELLRGFTYNFPISRIFDFSIGCILGNAFAKYTVNKEIIRISKTKMLLSIFELMLLAVSIAFMIIDWDKILGWHGEFYWPYKVLIFLISICPIIWVFMQCQGTITIVLSHSILAKFGDISGEFYLIHELVLVYLSWILRKIELSYPIYYLLKVCISFMMTLFLVIIWKKMKVKKEKYKLVCR